MNVVSWLVYVFGIFYLLLKTVGTEGTFTRKISFVLFTLWMLYYITDLALIHPSHSWE